MEGIKLDVNVDNINETLSEMFGEMIGGIIEMLDKLPNNTLDFSQQIYKALNTKGEVMKSMLPVINGSYIEKIYLKPDCFGEMVEPYAKTTNGKEYYINEESFYRVLNLCEFIQTYC